MQRTSERPLVTGIIDPRNALVFAVALEVAAFAVLWIGANLLSALLALGAAAFYVGVYTIWLKRTSTHNIVIGGAAGAVPVLVGWAAVTESLAWAPIVLFVVMFCWTPPHFWALAIRYADRLPCRRRADAAGGRSARRGGAPDGRLHGGDGGRDARARPRRRPRLDLRRSGARARRWLPRRDRRPLSWNPTPSGSMRAFTDSITYVTLLFGALTLDVLL